MYNVLSYTVVTPSSTTCLATSGILLLPSSTELEPLIFPENSMTDAAVPPTSFIEYLNSLPTVQQQLLGASIGFECDPFVGGTSMATLVKNQTTMHYTTIPAFFAETTSFAIPAAYSFNPSGGYSTSSTSSEGAEPMDTLMTERISTAPDESSMTLWLSSETSQGVYTTHHIISGPRSSSITASKSLTGDMSYTCPLRPAYLVYGLVWMIMHLI
jgi:hypothetical protein